jgi:hypothetical protein
MPEANSYVANYKCLRANLAQAAELVATDRFSFPAVSKLNLKPT